MKRASLSALPARSKAEPADLTDRLLDREAQGAPAQPAASAPPPAPKRAARRRTRPVAAPAPTEPAAPAPATAPPGPEPSLEQALRQAADTAQALRAAARAAPARYELALRYRLEALAHHVQQVAEFIHGRTQR